MKIEFRVNGLPKGQPRVRACRRGNHAGTFDPGTADDWKSLIAIEGKKHVQEKPIEGPVVMSVTFYFLRPKNHYGSRGQFKTWAPRYHVGRPDLDNAAKAVMDILTQIGMWKEDSQVAILHGIKLYADNFTGAEICIESLPVTQ